MKYDRFLKHIETAMDVSGVRNYCAKTCYGACCDGCFETENACHKNEGRRLACSLFICDTLKDIILTDRQNKVYRDLTKDITNALRKAGKAYDSLYFTPYTKTRIENFNCKTENLKKFVVFMKSSRIRRLMGRLPRLVKRANVSERRVKSIVRKEKRRKKLNQFQGGIAK